MRALVLGGAGFIGRHVCEALLARGHAVYVLDTRPVPELGRSENLRAELGSILDASVVDRCVGEADVVLHLAGIAQPAEYGRRPKTTMDTNLRGSLVVIDGVARHRVPMLFASTSEIYGMNLDPPWDEDAARVLGAVDDVRWCYSSSKAAVEHYLHACQREGGLDFTVARFFNVYGRGLSGRVVDAFVDRALSDEPLVIYGDGSHTRCFTYIDDVVDAVMRLVERGLERGGTFNVGSTEETTVRALADLVVELAGSRSPVVHVEAREVYPGYVDVPRRQPSIDRIHRACGWSPTVPLAEGLRRMIAATRESAAAFGR